MSDDLNPTSEADAAASNDGATDATTPESGVDTAVATTGSYGRNEDGSAETPDDSAPKPTGDELRDADGSIADNVTAEADGNVVIDEDAVAGDVGGEEAAASELDEPPVVESKSAAAAEPEDIDDDEGDVEAGENEKHWYVLKVASNRERTVKKALERQIKRENLEDSFGEIVIPTQKVKETKNGKVVEKEEKIWPGYIVVNMAINDDSWYLVRSVSGIGDFAGKAGEPSPMPPDEVDQLLGRKTEQPVGEEKVEEVVKINIPFAVGERVKVNETSLAGSEGDVTAIDPETGQVKVTIQFLGQPTDVDFEHWQLEKV